MRCRCSTASYKKTAAFQILQIAHVLAEERFAAAHNAHGVFQLSANRQDGRRFALQRHRRGHKPTGAAQLLRLARCLAHNGIVATPQDVAVVNKERVGNAAQAAPHLRCCQWQIAMLL